MDESRLATYVGAILGHPSPVAILDSATAQERWMDQGFEVRKEETIYRFDNGVAIRRCVEQDQFPTELACAECWICYEVVEPVSVAVSPARKTFENACREAFWLKYHTA